MSHPESRVRVAVFCKPHPEAPAVLHRVAETLRQHGAEMLPDDSAARALGISTAFTRDAAVAVASLVVALGGDGTLLAAAHAVGDRETQILGVNLGSLGFLTETRCEEVGDVLSAALQGRAAVEHRRVLQVTRNGAAPGALGAALNEIVFSKQDLARLFSLSLYVDDEWVADYRADGLILATPTGSTAYSLAAGGPLVAPVVDALVATPICPHSLSQRPLILPGSARIAVRLSEGQASTNIQVTIDGQLAVPLEAGETVTASLAAHSVHLIRPTGKTFFSVVRDKLGWGRR